MASPWPGIVDAHLETAWTLNTACGAADMFWTTSVLIRPGLIRVFQTFVGYAVVISSEVFLSFTGSVNR
jgi:hypothetical protein